MAISKIIYKSSAEAEGEVWMDVTQKTVTSGTMLSGTTALKNDGTDITGSIATKTSANLSASGATVTAPAGYYATDASKSVASGTAGTPTATKGTVSNHSVSVTPSVTNSTGYITGGTKTGTAVTVSVAELESGTKPITENGTGISVSGYSTVDVAVPTGGGSSYTLYGQDDFNVNTTSTSAVVLGTVTATGIGQAKSDGKILFCKVFDTAGKQNGHYYGTISYTCLPKSNFGTTFYVKSDGSMDYASNQYGIYVSLWASDSVELSTRYVSSFGTMSGNFHAEVYALDWPDTSPLV